MHASLRCSIVIEKILSANPDLKLSSRGSYWIWINNKLQMSLFTFVYVGGT